MNGRPSTHVPSAGDSYHPRIFSHRSQRVSRLINRAASESYLVLLVSMAAILLLAGLGLLVTADSWLALTAGRVVAESGPPSTDTLTTWTLGRDWIDQQWLSQLALYGLWQAGGLVLVGIVHVALVLTALVMTLIGARRRGGTSRDVALVGLLALVPIGLVVANIRTQSLALPLFVATLWLVSEHSRVPSRRVLWCLPLLVLWANLHGSVLVGAGLVGLAGVLSAGRALRGRGTRAEAGVGIALLAGIPVALLATPYGTALLSYFRELLSNDEIGYIASDWMPVPPEPVHIPFYLLAALSLALLGRDRHQLSGFDQVTLVVLLAGALVAQRNLAWFSFAVLLLLPPLLSRRRQKTSGRPLPLRLAATGSAAAVVGVLLAAAQGSANAERQLESRFPPRALAAVTRVADGDPELRLFVHPRYADWLLFRRPRLAGRIAMDIRYELLTPAELRRFRRIRQQIGQGWLDELGSARLVVLDKSERPLGVLPSTAEVLSSEPGARVLHDDRDVAVILRRVRG